MRNFRMNPRAKLEQTLPFTVGHSHRQTTYTRTGWKPNKFVVNAVNHADLIAGVSNQPGPNSGPSGGLVAP